MSLETFFTVSEQTMQFLLSAVLGAALGVVYDCFRVARIVLPPLRKDALVFLSDIIFMLICGGGLFLFSVIFCRASVRGYCIVGAAAGFTLYIVTVGSLITGIIRAVFSLFYGTLQKVYYFLFAPIVNILKKLYRKTFLIFVHSYENKRNIAKTIEK